MQEGFAVTLDYAIAGAVSMDSRHRGGGADGEGDGTSPAACLMRLLLNGIRGNTPTARPLTRPPPAPSIGGGQCVAIAPDTVHGEQVMDLGEGVHIEPQICSS